MSQYKFESSKLPEQMSDKIRVNFFESFGYVPFMTLYAKDVLHNPSNDLPYFELLRGDIHDDHFLFRHQVPLPKCCKFFYIVQKITGEWFEQEINL